MTLYLDYRVQSPDPSAINVDIEWHPQQPMLAVTSCSEERGGFLTIYDELVRMKLIIVLGTRRVLCIMYSHIFVFPGRAITKY